KQRDGVGLSRRARTTPRRWQGCQRTPRGKTIAMRNHYPQTAVVDTRDNHRPARVTHEGDEPPIGRPHGGRQGGRSGPESKKRRATAVGRFDDQIGANCPSVQQRLLGEGKARSVGRPGRRAPRQVPRLRNEWALIVAVRICDEQITQLPVVEGDIGELRSLRREHWLARIRKEQPTPAPVGSNREDALRRIDEVAVVKGESLL